MMKGVHTFRAGVEFKLAPEFAFRLDIIISTASMKPEAYKWIQSNPFVLTQNIPIWVQLITIH